MIVVASSAGPLSRVYHHIEGRVSFHRPDTSYSHLTSRRPFARWRWSTHGLGGHVHFCERCERSNPTYPCPVPPSAPFTFALHSSHSAPYTCSVKRDRLAWPLGKPSSASDPSSAQRQRQWLVSSLGTHGRSGDAHPTRPRSAGNAGQHATAAAANQ